MAAGVLIGASLLAGLASATPASAQTTPAACPADLKITVAPPATPTSTTVTATITPALNIKPATAADPQSFHIHYFVDVDPTKTLKAGTPIPTGDPKIIHSASTTQDVGALAAGPHTVWVVVGQVSHQACGGADGNIVTGSTTFSVPAQAAPAQPTAAAPAPAKSGTGGVAQARPDATVPLVLGGIALLAIAGARSLTGRRR